MNYRDARRQWIKGLKVGDMVCIANNSSTMVDATIDRETPTLFICKANNQEYRFRKKNGLGYGTGQALHMPEEALRWQENNSASYTPSLT